MCFFQRKQKPYVAPTPEYFASMPPVKPPTVKSNAIYRTQDCQFEVTSLSDKKEVLFYKNYIFGGDDLYVKLELLKCYSEVCMAIPTTGEYRIVMEELSSNDYHDREAVDDYAYNKCYVTNGMYHVIGASESLVDITTARKILMENTRKITIYRVIY